MNYLQPNNKIKKCEELITLISNKHYYKKYYEEIECWEIISKYYSNNNFEEFYPLIQSGKTDDFIVFDNQSQNFNLIHFTFPYNTVTGKYDNRAYRIDGKFCTPEEVWEQVIKPDIEEYYGIKIDE